MEGISHLPARGGFAFSELLEPIVIALNLIE
jgi:hypothetical protein